MKTKELINRVNGVKGIDAYNEDHRVNFYEIGQTFPFYTMDKKNVDFGQGVSNFANLRDTNMSRLSYVIDAIREYLETPLAEREEEKLYRLGLVVPPLLRTGHAKPSYLVIKCVDGSPDTSYSPMEYEGFQKIFTESEIAQMDITGFQKLEVPEC